MENPTDPNAGTDRNNAVSRDNLMNGASLKYSGYYVSTSLGEIGQGGGWRSSTISDSNEAHRLFIYLGNGRIGPVGYDVKFIGRSVRCISSPLVALVQDLIHCRMSIQASTTGVLVGFTNRRCMATTGHLLFMIVPIVTT